MHTRTRRRIRSVYENAMGFVVIVSVIEFAIGVLTIVLRTITGSL